MAELLGLERLLAKGLTQEEEVIARRYYSDKERDSMDADQFCGLHKSFPITSAADVSNAVYLIGKADDPAAVKACVMRKAKANGWPIPDAWKEDDKQERALTTSDRISMPMHIMRIDAAKREVWGQATAEVPDSYGTIFGYCPDAWTKWRGNVREQHDSKKAVGNRIDLECDEKERAIYVGTRVSRGAQDTWLKVEDNVLTGYSASVIPDPEFGPDPKRWPTKEYNGKAYPYLPRYTVAELSLVDNPACPGCNIQIVRADGFTTDVLDTTEEEPTNTTSSSSLSPLDRAGARVSSDTRDAMHAGIGHTLHAAVAQMKNCGCDSCMKAQKLIDPDGDGDIDIGSFDDPDQDSNDLYNGRDADMERKIAGMIERALSPVYARLQGIAGALARSNAPSPINIESIISGAITRTIEAANAAHESSLAEVRASLGAVKEQVDKIADTPLPGAPIMNAGALPRPIDKTLATDPYTRPRTTGSAVADAVAAMSASGQLDTTEKQVDALATYLAAQRRG